MADTVTKALIFVLALDLILALGQISVNYVAIEMGRPPPFIYNYQSDLISQTGTNYTVLNTSGVENRLFESQPTTDTNTGNFFTDTVKDVKNWFVSNIPGLNYLIGIVGAPASYLAAIGAPAEVSFAIGGLWFVLTIFLIVTVITGRNT
jgi:hypothetical protein